MDVRGLGSVAAILVSLPLSVKMKALLAVSADHEHQKKASDVSVVCN